MKKTRIGVLALQGAFIEHEHMLTQAGAVCTEVRQVSDLHGLDGIVLPGGESTVQGQLRHPPGDAARHRKTERLRQAALQLCHRGTGNGNRQLLYDFYSRTLYRICRYERGCSGKSG